MTDETWQAAVRLRDEALGTEDAAEAASMLREAVAMAPHDVTTRAYLAQTLLMRLRDPASVVAALEDGPDHADLAYFRAAALHKLGRADEGWAEFASAAELFANRAPGSDVLVGIGQSRSMHALLLGDAVGGSLSLLERGVAEDPLFGMTWHFLGYFLFKAGELDAAARALEVCASIEPDRIDEIREDDDFGSFRDDPPFVRALEAEPLDDDGLAELRGRFAGLGGLGGAALGREIRERLLAPPSQASQS